MDAGSPVIVILDRRKIGGGRPFAAHWAVAYRVEDTTVHLANTSGVEAASEASFLHAFRCRFMPKPFNHCASFPSMPPWAQLDRARNSNVPQAFRVCGLQFLYGWIRRFFLDAVRRVYGASLNGKCIPSRYRHV